MENDIIKKLDEQKKIIDKIASDVEKTKKYFFWTMVITIALIVLPMIAMIFVLPSFMFNYVDSLSNLSL